ncbi:Retrograde transport protein Dsl1 C-terminal [Penicillium verhagenii]|uniref:Retrograde transport protein Dsl1 C-terminal n=1 Tax=Penicillium verhagenii TaxID=1562060 RepID=UPI002544E90E|nr:Retrograde transport protein Dsl1 C-terminal [Penicillium verhagenii]KAJ5938710.1 Retrograde transport protein Dsl1 C-terminal [Penicillium verhagenii]
MPQVSESEICQAVLGFVTEGAYPDEKVVAAKFPAAALAKELELISQAREQVENEISSLSRENTFDADDWIIQAKQLHADIERSRVTAREIVSQHEQTEPLRAKVEDASAKVALIETEIAFNQAVTETLEEVQRLCQQLESGRTTMGAGEITAAIEQLESTKMAIETDTPFSNTNVMGILSGEVARLRGEIEEALCLRWSDQMKIDRAKGELCITDDTDSLDETIVSLSRLDIFSSANDKFQNALTTTIIDPILLPRADGSTRAIEISVTGVRVESASSKTTIAETLNRVTDVLNYLRQKLPSSMSATLPQSLIPAVASKAISGLLSSAIPTTLVGLEDFENTLDCVLHFTKTIQSWEWTGQEELVSWVNQAPRLWLTRRRVDSLDSVRKAIAASKGTTKQVERIEKEKVSQADEALLENVTTDDWDADWDDEKEEAPAASATSRSEEDEEDVSAWGLDEEENEVAAKPELANEPEEDDADDAWGWGDDDEEEKGDGNKKLPVVTEKKPTGGEKTAQPSLPKEVVLREVYTVTDIPDSILEIVLQQIFDSKDITQPAHSKSRVASSGAGLLALPTLILAMFKATSSSFYSLKLNSGQMYLYNDSLYLAGRVRELIEDHELSRLTPDVEALERFGKIAYSKEMQTQSTIVSDLLDGTQGFGQCSEQPYKTECENAVSATADRIRDVYKEWQPILSHSALLQSIGSLLSTVIGKIIMDVEDLGDISEDQSKQLVFFCNQISRLEDLFMPESAADSEAVPVTAVYVPNWLRFQYLINILDSSLADIKFLWVEGELSLEFSMDEVIDLIVALFAESDYRRRAIADIRRAPRE